MYNIHSFLRSILMLGLRASIPETRKKYVALVEAVQQKGGEVVIFSSMHESGQRRPIHFNTNIHCLTMLQS